MKTYQGTRMNGNATVFVIEERPDTTMPKPNITRHRSLLNPRHDIRNHSPDGFEWGYGGSGPAQLALAILADHFSDKPTFKINGHGIDYYYQDYKWSVIAELPQDGWKITTAEIDRWIDRYEKYGLGKSLTKD